MWMFPCLYFIYIHWCNKIKTEYFLCAEGNECSKVLNNLQSLADIIPAEFVAFYDCLKSLCDIVDGCFGCHSLDPCYSDLIQKFQSDFTNLQNAFCVSETVKVHIICEHVKEYLDMEGKPLGKLSEQELENSHSAFTKVWSRYKVIMSFEDDYKI